MKPVAIFRFAPGDGPGNFSRVLAERGIATRLFAMDAGDAIPTDPGAFAGIGLMGGPMSVNDALPWIAPVLALVRAAVAADVPLIGHCLGGQLMSKALGGRVGSNGGWEIGWGRVDVDDSAAARDWFGGLRGFDSFHWHGETFSIPPGATRIAWSAHCANQAFALGPHLGLQCHVEMTEAMIRDWTSSGAGDVARNRDPGVQDVPRIHADLPAKLPALTAVATGLYDRWISRLAR